MSYSTNKATRSKGSASQFPVAVAETLAAARTLTNSELLAKNALVFDPGGSNRVVTFPAEAGLADLHLIISNVGQELLTVQNDGAETILVIGPGQSGFFHCNGTTLFAGSLSAAGIVEFSETVAFDDFTDGGAAVGTFSLTAGAIPVGATFLYSAVTAVTGFAGDTSAVLTIGDGSDVDRYNTGTPSVFATAANGVAMGDPSGTRYHDTAVTPVLTVTSASDFTSVSAGSLTVKMYYLI